MQLPIELDAAAAAINQRTHDLDLFFKPRSVAVIGATDAAGHVGRAILWNLISSPFGGTVYPVNPKRSAVLGIRAYASVGDVPERVDLAVIVTPAESVPLVIAECAEAGVRGAVIISAGFRETGANGLALEGQILEAARKSNMRLIGPNCLGIMCPITGLNATFASAAARPGSVALISQSGAICTALLDWSLREQVGFSAFLSIGSMLDLGWGELIDYLGNDPHTRSIVIYMESIADARSFLSAAREVALDKPILVIKAGRTESAAKAAASHTGSLAGSDAVLDAALRRAGVLRIDALADIFYMTEALARQPRPCGPRLTIVTNAGGPGVLATDTLIGLGAELAPLTPETIGALNRVLPAHWSHNNPIDVIGDAGPERYEKAIEIAAKDNTTDGLLVIMTPQAMSDPVEIALKVALFAQLGRKPILASWMGGVKASEGEAVLNRAGIPTFPFPDTAVRAFHYMWRYSYNLRALYETPTLADTDANASEAARKLIEQVRNAGRTLLTEFESKQLLSLYGIPTVETHLAHTEEDAVIAANALDYPVVLKLNSLTVTHKTDVGGVKLGLRDADSVRTAYREIQSLVATKAGPEHFAGVTVQPMVSLQGYELIVGSSIDAQFGPVLLFGAGGQLVEVFQDRALALPPLNTTLALRFIEQTRIFATLQGVRGRKPIDILALETLLVRFSQLVLEQSWIREIDINPLLASPEGLLALDARVVLNAPDTAASEIPKPAIRPYPSKYAKPFVLEDGTHLNIRPIRPEDEPQLVRFHSTLSEQSVYRRYFALINLESRIRHERLTRMCFIDYDRQMALVAEHPNQKDSPGEIIGVGRLIKSPLQKEGELAAVVGDSFQRKGIGRELVNRLVAFARDENVELLRASVLAENPAMQRLLESAGFKFHESSAPEIFEGLLYLNPDRKTTREVTREMKVLT
ncbi:MAG TPA: bifunctional acetate--CoA ligase family protein/GNAT family N-acetyltransferase [Bryobacteraceae bacterium]|nr:bifunctional acetate--CoA ligase family protein/GNAT family N-acetyltransferase [Bryobacteraceae bacterium]